MTEPTKVQRVGERLIIVGTVHVDPGSRSRVRETVYKVRPEVVALELDRERLDALQIPRAGRLGLSGGASFLAMALLEKFAGQLTGSSPGLEMLEGARAAQRVGARVALIDRPIGYTVAGLRRLPLGEKVRIGVDGLASLAFLPFTKVDFSQLEEGIDTQLLVFRTRYPALSRLLLDEREKHMAEKIRSLLGESSGTIVAVVGFGHMRRLANLVGSYQAKPAYSSSLSWTLGAS